MASGLSDASNAIGGAAVSSAVTVELSIEDFEALRELEVNGRQATFSSMKRRGRPSKRSRVKQVRAFRNWRAPHPMLKNHNQPVGFKAALEANVTSRSKVKRAPKRSKKSPANGGTETDRQHTYL